jgi:hypothetical protein
LLTDFTNSPVRVFHSLEYFGIFDTVRPCWAHTKSLCQLRVVCRYKV